MYALSFVLRSEDKMYKRQSNPCGGDWTHDSDTCMHVGLTYVQPLYCAIDTSASSGTRGSGVSTTQKLFGESA